MRDLARKPGRPAYLPRWLGRAVVIGIEKAIASDHELRGGNGSVHLQQDCLRVFVAAPSTIRQLSFV
jgi:hypothetical protein